MAEERDTGWIAIQKRTFTRWVNNHLGERMLKVNDLFVDLETGILLINLLEVISNKKVANFNKNPKIRAQKLENNSFALNFLKAEGIKLVAIGPEDIVDHANKLILGLIWTIILRYQIQKGDSGGSAKNELLQWVRRQIPECDVNNFTTSWQDGKAVCHLADSLQRGIIPGGLDAVDANPDSLANATLGEDAAERELGIPKVLLPEDMVSNEPDELSVMTYISFYRDYLDNLAKRRSREEKEKTAVAEKTIAFGAGLTEGEQFIPTEFTIQARNCFGTDCPSSGENFEVVIKSPKKGNVPCTVRDHNNNDGKYTVSYTPLDQGKHVITVQLQGRPIQGSPFNVPIGKTSVSAQGPGTEKGEQYTPAVFTIQAAKMFQAGVPPGEGEFDVKVAGPKSNVEPTINDNKDGTFQVSYTPIEPGRHTVTINLRERPIANGPFSVPIEKTLCTAAGPGLEKGEQFIPGVFTITAIPLFKSGNAHGTSDFEVKISGPKQVCDPKITDNEDGTFSVVYLPIEVGRYNVAINLKGTPISNGPWSVPISQTGCSATGPGLDKAEQFVPAEFLVNAQPLTNAGVPVGPEDIDVKVVGPQGPIEAKVTPNDDGTFNVAFTPRDIGRHNVTAAVKGQPICSASVPVQKTTCTASGPGLDKAEQFLPTNFTVDASPITKAGEPLSPDEVLVKIVGPQGPVSSRITPNDDGTFNVDYTPIAVGPHTVAVAVKGQEIASVPVTVNKTHCTASGPGLEKGEQFIPSHFTINAENLYKSGFFGGVSDFDVKIAGPKGPVESTITDNSDGTFAVSYTPKEPGKFTVAVSVKGQPISNGPFNVPVDKTTCRASGPGLENAEQFLPAQFTVDCSPLSKAGVPPPPEDVQVKINGPQGAIPFTVTPNEDGTFNVSYTPKEIGKANVQVALKGTDLANVAVPVQKTGCTAGGPGLDKAEQFVPTTFTIDARPLEAAGIHVSPEDVATTVTGPNGPIAVTVAPNEENPGVFDITYTPKDVGPHRVNAALRGQELVNKPVNVQKTSCRAFGPGLENAEQFIPAHFTVDATTPFKNGVPIKPEEVDVKVVGPQGLIEPTIKDNEDGTFEVTYTPKEFARHNIITSVKGQEIDKHSVPVVKTTCTASGPGLEKAEQFVPATFTVDCSPLSSNNVPLSPEEIDVKITGPHGPLEPVIQEVEPGKYNVSYTPKDIARHNVQVNLKGTPIANVTVPVTKTGVTAIGIGLEKAEQFLPAIFNIDAKTLLNSGVPLQPEEIAIRVTSPTGVALESFVAPVQEDPGNFTVWYVPQEIGKHTVNAIVKSQEIANRPVFVSKTTCGASGPGLEKATQFLPATFTVETANLKNAGVPANPEDVAVKVVGPQGAVEPQITPNEDGTFLVTYVPDDQGRHAIEVFLKGTPICNKSVPVTKTGIQINGDGIAKAEQYIPSDFQIDARELKNEGVAPAAEDFDVKIQSPSGQEVPVEVENNDDGTYNCKYTPIEPGRHKLAVGLKGRPILPSHFIPVDKSTTDASKSTASGPGLEPGNVINQPTHFIIQARNKIAEPMKTGGDPFKVEITGPYNAVVEPHIQDNADGTYNVTYEPTLQGDHNINVTLNGVPIIGAPWTVPIERGDDCPDPSQFDVYGPGLEGGDTADPCIFTIVAKNSKGEPLKEGGYPVSVEIFGPNGLEIPVHVEDNQDGTFQVQYQPKDPGPHQVDVQLSTKIPLYYDHIKDSPYKVPIVAGTDPSASLVWGPGLEEVFDTKPTEFYIQARDRDGNEMGRGGDPFNVEITGPNGPVEAKVEDKGDGNYLVTYAPQDHGPHTIAVTLREKPVAKSPYFVTVKEGASYEHTLVEKFQFTVRSKTKSGENKLVGGETFVVSIEGQEGPVDGVTVSDEGDGSYTCRYVLPYPGEFSISVKLNDHEIKGSPFTQKTPE